MRQMFVGLGVTAAFLAGCVAGGSQWLLPSAKAASSDGRHWAYLCFQAQGADEVQRKANAAGASGWEMSSATPSASDGGTVWCFKQPAR